MRHERRLDGTPPSRRRRSRRRLHRSGRRRAGVPVRCASCRSRPGIGMCRDGARGQERMAHSGVASRHGAGCPAQAEPARLPVRNINSGKLMEVAGLSRVDGGDVATWSDDDVPQQRWAVTPTGDGYHHLTNRLGGLSLTVDGGSTADGADIEQETYRQTHRQQCRSSPCGRSVRTRRSAGHRLPAASHVLITTKDLPGSPRPGLSPRRTPDTACRGRLSGMRSGGMLEAAPVTGEQRRAEPAAGTTSVHAHGQRARHNHTSG
ncbi:RICIN domain-containing protein [Streptomyces europaeiscabiei]|uniref:RICIN domain-containing protein n=1 Tax=Streptomyces europaeiscabiei TaxID=146819 RepID=UPI0038D4BEA0